MPAARSRSSIFYASVCLGLVCLSLTFGSFRKFDEADYFVVTLVSLQKYQLFYWGQNRYGTLAPLLCLWIHDPLWNHFAENAIMVVGFLASLSLLRNFSSAGPSISWGVCTLIGMLCVLTPETMSYFASLQPYPLSLGLFMVGWRIGRRGGRARMASAWLFFLLSFWVNIGLAPWGAPLLWCRSERRSAWLAAVLATAFLVDLTVAALYPYRIALQLGVNHQPLWSALRLSLHGLACLRPIPLAVWSLLSWLAYIRQRQSEPGLPSAMRRIAVALLGGNLLYFALLCASNWIHLNLEVPRYLTPIFWSLFAWSSLPLAWWVGDRPRELLTSLALLAVLALSTLGFRTPADWLATWSAPDQKVLAELQQSRAEILVGEYWSTWSRVFFFNAYAYREGRPQIVGCSERADCIRSLWQPKMVGGSLTALDLKSEQRGLAWLAMVRPPLEGLTFVPETIDADLVIGRWLPSPASEQSREPFAPLALGENLQFARSTAWTYLGQGWANSDNTGRFTAAATVDVRFSMTPPAHPVLHLEVAPLLTASRPRQRLEVWLNGVGVARGDLHQTGVLTLAIPLSAGALRASNVLRFVLPDATAMGEWRRLAVSMISMSISEQKKLP